MNAPQKATWKNDLRITWAITRKDILDAIRNKYIITALFSALFIIVMYRALPLLESLDSEIPNLWVYDAGESTLMVHLENSPNVRVFDYPSLETLMDRLTNESIPAMGLVIPADFDQRLASGQALELPGYVANWVSAEQARELQNRIGDEINRLLDRPVTIQMDSNVAYMTPESGGLAVTTGLALIFVCIMTGVTMIPHLMLEEKKAHTMETLLLSPARPLHVVLAKALTGLFYCMLAAGIGLGINYFLVLHWGLAILTMLLGSLLAIALGLLLGTLIDDRSQLTLLAWIVLMPLFIPVILYLLESVMPEALVMVTSVIPSTVILNLLRASFAKIFDWGTVLLQLAWLATCAGLVLASVAWLLQRKSSQGENDPLSLRRAQPEPAASAAAQTARPVARIATTAEAVLPTTAGSLADRATATEVRQTRRASGLRIIAAIAAKDIRDALRNKILISIMLGMGIMVGSSLILPMVARLQDKPTAIVYDPGHSSILRGLAAGRDFRLGVTNSLEEMQRSVSSNPELTLGLALPADFDSQAGSGEPVMVTGYAVHWAKADEVNELATYFAEKLNQAGRGKVQIQVSSQPLYPGARAEGHPLMIVMTFAIALLTLGIVLVPLLMLEEKEAHTFEALLISPARYEHIIAGKTLAGVAYCLAAMLGILLLANYLVVQWGLMLWAILMGMLFAIGLGILLGLLTESQAKLNAFAGALVIVLMSSGVLEFFDASRFPTWMQMISERIPTTAIMRLFGLSMSNQFAADIFWQSTFTLLAYSTLIYILVAWAIRRSDR